MTINFFPGMGEAVAKRTILRQNDGSWETWADVAKRVAAGNAALHPFGNGQREAIGRAMRGHMERGVLVMSGRHLQHGDHDQVGRDGALFTNCGTACQSFLSFLLLNCGSGIGRLFYTGMYPANRLGWNTIDVACVLSCKHQDFRDGVDVDPRKLVTPESAQRYFKVPDSREGWAKALELWENPPDNWNAGDTLVLDFSGVRPKGSPIAGMQDRPASGPCPLIDAFRKAFEYLRGEGLKHRDSIQCLHIDHFFAECVVVGGARRSARLAAMHWRDEAIFDFINAKRPEAFIGKSGPEIQAMRATGEFFEGRLWSANNSILVDTAFWYAVKERGGDERTYKHALAVFKVATEAGYYDGTGEPGFITVDNLERNDRGIPAGIKAEQIHIGSFRYGLEQQSKERIAEATRHVQNNPSLRYITNPCGEIVLHSTLGGFCVIADVIPFHADSIEQATEGFAEAGRALIRTNLMDSIYASEVRRTNRIGVGLTGVHEFAAKFFQVGFRELIRSESNRALAFWNCLRRFREHTEQAIIEYCAEIGVREPHTAFTIKPSGTVSKLFGLTEGWHLPSMRRYLRWVQFQNGSEVLEEYKRKGYPWRELKTYAGVTIVGFPTEPVLAKLLPDDKIVTAGEATMAEQYRWLELGERYWIRSSFATGLGGNQISYTLKFDPEKVSYRQFREAIKKHQSGVRCCSVMPQAPMSAYEYQPEEPISKARFDEIVAGIRDGGSEDIGREHLECAGGACPIDFKGDTQ